MSNTTKVVYTFNTETQTHAWQNGASTVKLTQIGLAENIVVAAIRNGLKQKVADSMAIPHDKVTGKAATIAEKFAAAQQVVDNLLAGIWNGARETGPRVDRILVMAIAEVKGCGNDVERIAGIQAYVAKMDAAKQKAMAGSKPFAKAYDAILARQPKADVTAELAELEGL